MAEYYEILKLKSSIIEEIKYEISYKIRYYLYI